MANNFKREDLRVIKTRNALCGAMIVLLRRRRFDRITVYDLCNEALVSRTAFYMHFKDKYDLLNCCLSRTLNDHAQKISLFSEDEVEHAVGEFIHENKKILFNLVRVKDDELHDIVYNFLISLIETFVPKDKALRPAPDLAVLLPFCAGGLIRLLSSQTKEDLLERRDDQSTYLCRMIKALYAWDTEQG
jgi:AcrR family transcriptional regulator